MSHPTIHLQRSFFTEAEKTLAEFEGLTASTFLYPTDIQAIRLKNQLGEIIVLPFKGQQVWDAQFYGRTLTMKSMFNQPYATNEYLHTYGAYVVHCGATAMGVPSAGDTHPLHGELPNAPYQTAQLLMGQDERGPYLAVTGTYQYTVAFMHNYVAQPMIKLYANSSRMPLSMTVTNLKHTEMELMYMAHVNFRPVDNGELVYSAPGNPDHVRLRSSIPAHAKPIPGYLEFLAELEAHPQKHHILKPELAFNPEVVFIINYQADESGWAHSLHLHPDGAADFISHRPAELEHGVRWISRTPDQDCLGLVLPATAGPEGYTVEKSKGRLKTIPAGGQFHCQLEVGALRPAEVKPMRQQIEAILKKG